MDHTRWETGIKCFNQKQTLCSKVLSTSCKPDKIRAIYQHVAIKKEVKLQGFNFSLQATSDHFDSQVSGATFGAYILVKLSSGKYSTVRLEFSTDMPPMTLKSTDFKTSKDDESIISMTVMLLCFGVTGNIVFANVMLLPKPSALFQERKVTSVDFIDPCPGSHETSNKFRVKKVHIVIPQKQGHNTNLKQKDVTLVTQISMDRMGVLQRSLSSWEGPVSLVIYISWKGQKESNIEWQRLYIQKKVNELSLHPGSSVTVVSSLASLEDYPINTLRNIAIKQAQSKYLLLTDADFQTSPGFKERFFAVLKQYSFNQKTAFIVPAFEYLEQPQKQDGVPESKYELLQLLHREDAFVQPFRISESSESHRLTDYWKWYRTDKPYKVHTFSDKFEPYIVLEKNDRLPLYDERFFGYGMNKVTHITELYLKGFSFVVLPNVWLIHQPHRASIPSVDFLQNPQRRLYNRLERFQFIEEVHEKYHICYQSKT
ncbi:xylosyl- and glucuronyltransferase LARGE1-like [Tachypleus tridentatus]|uniref:xylosyl- and glucuronyltransferase LARGE1-like n=1 Tax=Tachypleus tridentatus TaxID=6853 RepID=UPI003FD33921